MLQFIFPFAAILSTWMFQENEAPRIHFKEPSVNSLVRSNSTLRYQVAVDDKEDGSLELAEIPANEVFVKIKIAGDQLTYKEFLTNNKLQAGTWKNIIKNGCFNCHMLRDKSAGPSFEQITNKYVFSDATVTDLAKKIVQGSKGIWGDSQQMPSHPEMGNEEARDLARWILRNAGDKDLQITVGSKGSIKTKPAMVESNKAYYVMIASYVDHGIDGKDQKQSEAILALPFEQ